MATLTADQIAGYAKAAGFPDSELRTAVGVALAESSGNTNAHNGTGKDNSYGLWQINMYGNMGPDRRRRFGISRNEELYDPAVNAKAAYIIWKDSGWKAWTTYTNNAYATVIKEVLKNNPLNPLSPLLAVPNKPLNAAGEAAVDTGSAVIGAAGAVKAGLNGLTSAIDNFTSNAVKTVWNIGAIIVAVVIIVLGFVLYFKDNPVVKKVTK